MKIFFTA